MVSKLLSRVFGTHNDRVVAKLTKSVDKINALEDAIKKLTDKQLAAKTPYFKKQLAAGKTLDDLLPEAFAVVREASVRTLGMRHFDTQLIGGMVLHQGKIAEMRCGEGKTLAGTLPVYLNALSGKGVHLVTVNDYLANRDAEWMTPIYELLGLTVGVNLSNMSPEDKQKAYAADVTYGTNNEFGFDYLRDNMAFRKEDRVQRGLNYAIIDEVDSILIDEARTPLIISGMAEGTSELYQKIDTVVPKLKIEKDDDHPGDYTVDEKEKQAFLTERGHKKVEKILADIGLLKNNKELYDYANIGLLHHINAALRAHSVYQADVDYIVKDNQVVIVDEHTGRLMDGRRWSDGLHQAVEAKEKVAIQNENQTLASITFQNYFRLFNKLSGMTGTADTEAQELREIYGLDVVILPTNRPMIHDERHDHIYMTVEHKYKAIIKAILDCQKRGQPVLVGTASIDSSELISKELKKKKIKHEVLNAKNHEGEAKIIEQAGKPGVVTIATNMAGRGTDIVLGGNVEAEIAQLKKPSDAKIKQLQDDWQQRHQQALDAGGLHVLCTERNESRRVDNQLRGRSGRQGDPGSSQFYLSLEDNLMRIFASERIGAIIKRLGVGDDEVLNNSLVNRAIENAQRKVEGYHFDVRKQLLKFDNVANDQRKVIYEQRSHLMELETIAEDINELVVDVVDEVVARFVPPGSLEEQWDIKGLQQQIAGDFNLQLPLKQWLDEDEALHEESLKERILKEFQACLAGKEVLMGAETMRDLEKSIMMQSLDMHWKEHLAAMDYLRKSVGLRGYAQKDPIQEYKRESFEMFQGMLEAIKYHVVSVLLSVQVQSEEALEQAALEQAQQSQALDYQHGEEAAAAKLAQPSETVVRQGPKVGRNEPCPCGSGKKYKACCGRLK